VTIPRACGGDKDNDDMADSVVSILLWLLQILTYALIGRALLSWFDPGQQWAISRILADITEPLIAPIRRVVPPVGMLDISFIVAIIVIMVLQRLLTSALL
jgi:YggT family protein